MHNVVSSGTAGHHLKQLRAWLVAEWGETELFRGLDDRQGEPSPLLAVDGDELLGGLVFSRYPGPGSNETALWINGLIVAPDHRRRGVGAGLIEAAQAEARAAGIPELFVCTDLPELYRRLGWQIVRIDDNGTVLRFDIEARQVPDPGAG